jgi:hypothetical protein
VLAAAERDVHPEALTLRDAGPAPGALTREIFVCRSESFWAARALDGATCTLRIASEVVLFQSETPGFVLLREDVAIPIVPGAEPMSQLLRLLPPWTVVRPLAPQESP